MKEGYGIFTCVMMMKLKNNMKDEHDILFFVNGYKYQCWFKNNIKDDIVYEKII